MEHYRSLIDVPVRDAWITIGSFDGVHRGHQEVIRHLVAGARASHAPAVVVTFFPHPALVLGKRKPPHYLTSPEERASLLGDLGVDIVITHPFSPEIAAWPAREFVSRLHTQLEFKRLCVGPNFALGHGREGDIPFLTALGAELGYEVEVLPLVQNKTEIISSSRIRNYLRAGDVEGAARLLGRPFSIPGKVIPGDGRGKTLGIPTANLDTWIERTLPKVGVYACRCYLSERVLGAVTNIGFRPTFKNAPAAPRVEAHLLNFEGDLYGREIKLEFVSRLRAEKKFPDVKSLVSQIHGDIAQAKEILAL